MTSWGMRSGFWKMNFSEPCRYSLHITAALWVAVICRNIEAVTTRRSWKPFAQKARGFESLFLRHKNEHHPSWMVFVFIPQSEGTNSLSLCETGSSHTAGTEHTTRNRLTAVSASQGDVSFNQYFAERLAHLSPRAAYPSSKPALQIGIWSFIFYRHLAFFCFS